MSSRSSTSCMICSAIITLLSSTLKDKHKDGPSHGHGQTSDCRTCVFSPRSQSWSSLIRPFRPSGNAQSIAHQLPQGLLTKSLPLPNTLTYVCPAAFSLEQARAVVSGELASFDIDIQTESSEVQILTAKSISWTRSARRARARGEASTAEQTDLVCEVAITRRAKASDGPAELDCIWVRGRDRHAFESLFSYLARKLAAAAATSQQGSADSDAMQLQ